MSSATEIRSRPRIARGLVVSIALIAVPVGLILLLLGFGSAGSHETVGAKPAPASGTDPFPQLLAALPVILVVCHLAGVLSRRLGQPKVIGEIIAGVMLGPSILGWLFPAVSTWLFPNQVVAAINTLAQLGVIFFMYLVGSEINLQLVRRHGFTALTVSQVSVALPMLSGIVLAFALYPTFGEQVGFLPFALFIAVSMSVTALPVLARILADRGIADTPVGQLALTCAVICDVAAWCLLAMVIAIGHDRSAYGVLLTIVLAAAFVAVLVFGVRPVLAGWLARVPESATLPILLTGVMLSALCTSEIGVHPIFGAFVFGAIVPRAMPSTRRAHDKLESVTTTLLLPLFFVYTGLHTTFALLGSSGGLWAWCAVITVVAVASKWGGSAAAARLTGLGWRDSLSLGALMNCRGLTELVVLDVGRQLKVISPTLFAILVIMTLVSTIATAPGLSVIARFRRRKTSKDGMP